MDVNPTTQRRLVIISGRSGSGKSVAMRELEDTGYYCVDNLPVQLLDNLLTYTLRSNNPDLWQLAVAIDARNLGGGISLVMEIIEQLRRDSKITVLVIYLDAQDRILLQRYKETRRTPPLISKTKALPKAIEEEQLILADLRAMADQKIDTTSDSAQILCNRINSLCSFEGTGMHIQLVSFGYKKGILIDADIVFDVRCLPNPYWQQPLRNLPGTHPSVVEFMNGHKMSLEVLEDLSNWLRRWVPRYLERRRRYLTLGIGCTGGRHRSVFICESIKKSELNIDAEIHVRHRDLDLAATSD